MKNRHVLALAIMVALLPGCGGDAKPRSGARSATVAKPVEFADLVAEVRTGVIRIEADLCDGETAVGTGFLLTPRLVATVHHVVANSTGITLKRGSRTVGTGTVVGEDSRYDLALVRTSAPITGHRFQLAARSPRLGEDVAAIGFPLGLPLSVTRGSVSGLNRSIPIDGVARGNLVQTDAAVNQGNSGGPLITNDGDVVGHVDLGTTEANGLAFAVSAKKAAPLLSTWRQVQRSEPPSSCSSPGDQGLNEGSPPPPVEAPDVATFAGNYFSISYPQTWNVETQEADKGAYFDTSIRGPDSVLLRVDVTPNPQQDLESLTGPLIDAVSTESGYQELDRSWTTFQGADALRWEFLVNEDGVPMHKVDLFFLGYSGDEFALLTQSRADRWTSFDDAFDAIRDTFLEQ